MNAEERFRELVIASHDAAERRDQAFARVEALEAVLDKERKIAEQLKDEARDVFRRRDCAEMEALKCGVVRCVKTYNPRKFIFGVEVIFTELPNCSPKVE